MDDDIISLEAPAPEPAPARKSAPARKPAARKRSARRKSPVKILTAAAVGDGTPVSAPTSMADVFTAPTGQVDPAAEQRIHQVVLAAVGIFAMFMAEELRPTEEEVSAIFGPLERIALRRTPKLADAMNPDMSDALLFVGGLSFYVIRVSKVQRAPRAPRRPAVANVAPSPGPRAGDPGPGSAEGGNIRPFAGMAPDGGGPALFDPRADLARRIQPGTGTDNL